MILKSTIVEVRSSVPENHGITEAWDGFGWNGPSKPPARQGHLPLDGVAQISIQAGLEHFQGHPQLL